MGAPHLLSPVLAGTRFEIPCETADPSILRHFATVDRLEDADTIVMAVNCQDNLDLFAELQNIAFAVPANFENDTEFRLWAQSRARAAIAKVEGGAS